MTFNWKEIEAWVKKAIAAEQGEPPPSYVTVSVRQAQRSWSQRARISVLDRKPEIVLQELRDRLEDIASSGKEEGNGRVVARVAAHREAGSVTRQCTFTAGDGPEADEGSSDVKGEAVSVIRELRIMVIDQQGHMAVAARKGWDLALQLQAELVLERQEKLKLELENALLKAQSRPSEATQAAIRVAEQMAPLLAPTLIELLTKALAPQGGPAGH